MNRTDVLVSIGAELICTSFVFEMTALSSRQSVSSRILQQDRLSLTFDFWISWLSLTFMNGTDVLVSIGAELMCKNFVFEMTALSFRQSFSSQILKKGSSSLTFDFWISWLSGKYVIFDLFY